MRFEDTVPGRRDQLMIELLYSTGMRRKELIGLRLADWDRSKRILRIQGKGNKERFLPVLPEIQEMLKAYLEDMPLEADRSPQAPLLRTDKGKPLYPTFVYRTINKYLQEVSTKVKKSPHILRHTFATHLLNRGADLNSVKELLGHASLASTQVYTHSSIEELKKVHQAAHPRSEKK
jgi:integrase/recombinase XerC